MKSSAAVAGEGDVAARLAGRECYRCAMAWRIDEHVIKGEIDNRVRGRVTGRIWFVGREEPVRFELEGNAWRDLAGRRLEFVNPEPKPGLDDGFAQQQAGTVGDITASRKVKVPDVPMDEVMELIKQGKAFPWHWGNSLYFEWFSESNGRVVIESASYRMTISPDSTWDMTAEEEDAQRTVNGLSMVGFMDRLASAVEADEDVADGEDNAPTAETIDWEVVEDALDAAARAEELEADALEDAAEFVEMEDGDDAGRAFDGGSSVLSEEEAERMQEESDKLIDRVMARLEKEGPDADYAQILHEELERARKERGEPDLTPEEEAERERWMDEMNAIAEEAAEALARGEGLDDDDETWLPGDDAEADDEAGADAGAKEAFGDKHPLSERAFQLTLRVMREVEERGWVPDDAGSEHPAVELVAGISKAGAKLAGALDSRDWPPPLEFTGHVIVSLKQAVGYLEDMKLAAESCRAEELVEPDWLDRVIGESERLMAEAAMLIGELRGRRE